MDGRTSLSYPEVVLKPNEEGRLQSGHLWAFSNEIAQAPASAIEPGALADLYNAKKGFLGRGFYHPHSLIAFRVLTDQKEQEIDEVFLMKRFQTAMDQREQFFPTGHAYRWIFGESDRLPGLVVDRYGDILCVQAIAAGMELIKPLLISTLAKVSGATGIVWRSDSGLREMEGLKQAPPEVVFGKVPERIEITTENGTFLLDPHDGQKTGFYFDQRENRQVFASYCEGKRVLDAFCYSGGFGIAAGRAGARQIVFLDSAAPALELAAANAEKNGTSERSTFVQGDAAAFIEHEHPEGPFDVISIDPPAFARSKKHLPAALKGYEKLNAAAMRAVKRGGILATSSCSHHVGRELFIEMLRRSARRAVRQVRLLELRSQSKDHPVLLSMPETEYLKCAILQVL
jgi:23S rRNA (cytosine1962-C5)-methyltransferase